MSMPTITERKSSGQNVSADGGRYQRVFDVIATSAIAAQNLVLAQRGIERGTVYTSAYGETPDPKVTCQAINVTEETPAPLGGAGRYVVTCEYARSSSGFSSGRGGARKQAEVGGPAVWWVETTLKTVPADHDRTGLPIANVNEEPTDPPLQRQLTDETLCASWYEDALNELTLYAFYRPFKDKVNDLPFHGILRGCALFQGVKIDPVNQGLYKLTAKWHVAPTKTLIGVGQYIRRVVSASGFGVVTPPIEGWADVQLHRGRRKLVDPSELNPEKRYQIITDKDGKAVGEPVLLSSAGQPLAAGQPPVALVTYHYDYIDFAQMNIP